MNKKFQDKYENPGMFDIFNGLSSACAEKNLEEIEYLITTPDLISSQKEIPILWLMQENFELFKSINLMQFKDKFNINGLFECVLRSPTVPAIEAISYFIFDLNIERTNTIDEILLNKPNENVEKAFTSKELNKSLNQELDVSGNNSKKIKI